MEIKGIAFAARRDSIIKHFGEDAWNKFLEKLKKNEPYFKSNILPTTLIPEKHFLLFQEEVIKEFFKGDRQAYWTNGEESAEFSLLKGPYQNYLNTSDIKNFAINVVPMIWKRFYTEGELSSTVNDNIIDVRVTGVKLTHIYYEFLVMGFIRKAFELIINKPVQVKKIKGPSSGDTELDYQIIL